MVSDGELTFRPNKNPLKAEQSDPSAFSAPLR